METASSNNKGIVRVTGPYTLRVQQHPLLQFLYENKYEFFIAGGCLRDIRCGRRPKDVDVFIKARLEIETWFIRRSIGYQANAYNGSSFKIADAFSDKNRKLGEFNRLNVYLGVKEDDQAPLDFIIYYDSIENVTSKFDLTCCQIWGKLVALTCLNNTTHQCVVDDMWCYQDQDLVKVNLDNVYDSSLTLSRALYCARKLKTQMFREDFLKLSQLILFESNSRLVYDHDPNLYFRSQIS